VSFETSFDSKQLKLEPKLVSAISETKRLFPLFCFYTETEIFDVLIEPKQFNMEYNLVFFSGNLGVFRFFRFVLVSFGIVCFGCFASIPKQRVSMFRFN
jgi:hypothetical protein